MAAWEARIRNLLKRYDITADADRLRDRAEDRRAGDLADLRGRGASSAGRRAATVASARTSPTTCARSASIPLRIDDAPELIEVRGEVYFPAARLREAERAARRGRRAHLRQPAQRRRRHDPPAGPQARRRASAVDLVATGSAPARASTTRTHSEEIEWLRERGFRVNADIALHETSDEVVERCEWWEERREGLDYEIDGVVVKVDERAALARPGRRRARAALGDRVEVPADDGDDEAEQDRLERRADRPPGPVRDARAGPRRRRHRPDRDPAQRGGPGAQGRPRGRRGDRHARRRRDPAGGRAADPAAQGKAAAQGAGRRRSARSAARRR